MSLPPRGKDSLKLVRGSQPNDDRDKPSFGSGQEVPLRNAFDEYTIPLKHSRDSSPLSASSRPSLPKLTTNVPRGYPPERPSDSVSNISLSPQRRRPRGSEVGKSIHKAAEACGAVAALQTSPTVTQSRRERRHSLGPPKRMTPAPRGKGRRSSSTSDEDSQSDSDRHSPFSPGSKFRSSSHRSTNSSTHLTSSDDDMSMASSDILVSPQLARKTVRTQLAPKAARKIPQYDYNHSSCVYLDFSDYASSSEEERLLSHKERKDPPPKALLDAFKDISFYPTYFQATRRLPFLTRNIRSAFRALCSDLKLDNYIPWERIIIIYKHLTQDSIYRYRTVMASLRCPLCSLFGEFQNMGALAAHLKWDHGEVQFVTDSKGQSSDIVMVTIILGESSDTEEESEGPAEEEDIMESERRTRSSSPVSDFPASVRPKVEEDEVILDLIPMLTRIKTEGDTEVTSSFQPQSSKGPNAETNTSATSGDDEGDTAETTPLEHIEPQAGVSTPFPSTIPHPPPQTSSIISPPLSNPHGPVHPIIQPGDPTNLKGSPRSYRPTGPHLYDHLTSLPLDAFGNRTWFILDKEEEIFELTDVLDEDKVVCVLWGRWILLNRSFFMANYLKGVEAFVDEYWLIIHHAAGWGALRAFLLVLVSRRFLKNIEMVQVIKRYNTLVGKHKWHCEN